MSRSSSPFFITKATLPALKKKRDVITSQINHYKESIKYKNVDEKIQQYEILEKSKNEKWEKIRVLEKQTYQLPGLLNKFKDIREINPDAKNKIATLRAEISNLDTKMSKLNWIDLKVQKHSEYNIHKLQEFLDKLDNRIEFFKKKKENLTNLKNRAEGEAKKIRALGTSVKKGLQINALCPYCGNFIDGIPHADHIYPVSKGGYSVRGNMVYVCSDCNLKKKDMTLQKFIQKFNFNRDEIESRLNDLKKDY
jgi:5-methylcytosine-specific restriction endonuclease McrA